MDFGPTNCILGHFSQKCRFWAQYPFLVGTIYFLALSCVDTQKTQFCVENNSQFGVWAAARGQKCVKMSLFGAKNALSFSSLFLFLSFLQSRIPGFNNMCYPASAYQGVNESVPHEIRILISFIPSTGCKVEFYNLEKVLS